MHPILYLQRTLPRLFICAHFLSIRLSFLCTLVEPVPPSDLLLYLGTVAPADLYFLQLLLTNLWIASLFAKAPPVFLCIPSSVTTPPPLSSVYVLFFSKGLRFF